MKQHVVIYRLSAMGDVAMLVHSVYNALHNNSDLNITIVTRPHLEVLFGEHERLSFHSIDTENSHKNLPGLIKFANEIKSLNPDLFIDMHDVLRSQIIRSTLKFNGVKVAVFDKGRREKEQVLSRRKSFEQLHHSIERYNEAFTKSGFRMDPNFRFVIPTYESEYRSSKKLRRIGIAPFAAHVSKEWGLDNIKALLKLIEKEGNYEVLLFGGGKDEVRKLKELTYGFKNVKSVAGQFRLEEELTIMKSCEVFIAMDSSNMHMADLVGCKVISIWIATHPYFGFYAWNNSENSIVLSPQDHLSVPLSIFGKLKSEKEMQKVSEIRKLITPEMVYNKLTEILD